MSTRFLTKREIQNVQNWQYHVDDKSISTQLLTPFWNYLLTWFPEQVAPNIMTLAGFLCILQACYLTYTSYDTFPKLTTLVSVILLFAYQNLDALDGKQARKIRNSSPIGELFDHTCDNLGVVFIILTVCWIYEINDHWLQWLLIQNVQMIFMWTHLVALKEKVITFGRWSGPGEVLLATQLFLLFRLFDAQAYLRPLLTSPLIEPCLIGVGLLIAFFIASYAMTVPSQSLQSNRNALWLCFGFRFLASGLTYYFATLDTLHVICDGLFWSLVTGDLILAKMAKRDIHPWIPIFAMMSVLHPWMVLAVSLFYYLSVFHGLCQELNIPMFNVVRTVYVNGVFDLGHFNHMKMFENALEMTKCNRLVVGVMSDADVREHKGPNRPVDTLEQRVKFVEMCRSVSKVIPNAPWDDVPEEFMQQHGIHEVAHGEEYDPEDPKNKWEDYTYKTPWQKGIVTLLPRGQGMSTTLRVNKLKGEDTTVVHNYLPNKDAKNLKTD